MLALVHVLKATTVQEESTLLESPMIPAQVAKFAQIFANPVTIVPKAHGR